MSESKKTLKLHARVTKEIEISYEDAEKLVNYLCESTENNDISGIIEQFQKSTTPGNYESGYIPEPWLTEDLTHGLADIEGGKELLDYLTSNRCETEDIEF